MLRCGRCGEEVSEWAARCRRCGEPIDTAEAADPTETAEEASPTDSAEEAANPTAGDAATPHPNVIPQLPETFDGAEGKSDRTRWRTSGAVVAAAVVVVGAVVLVCAHLLSGHGSHPLRPLRGDIVSVSPNGPIVLSDPAGLHTQLQPGFGNFAVDEGRTLLPSLDNRLLVESTGKLVAVVNGGLPSTSEAVTLSRDQTLASPDPFADHDRDLAVYTPDALSPLASTVSVVPIGADGPVRLGDYDTAAGDPMAAGVFGSVAATPQPSGSSPTTEVDVRIELIDVGRSPIVLATSAQLNDDLHQPAAGLVNLTAFPDPAGDKVAVVVSPAGGIATDSSLVILNRAGAVLATITGADEPVFHAQIRWSPNGKSLSYYAFGSRGAEIIVATPAGHPHGRLAPDAGASFAYCLWSPDSTAILYATDNGSGTGDGAHWVEGNASGGPLVQVDAAGVPIQWIASGPDG